MDAQRPRRIHTSPWKGALYQAAAGGFDVVIHVAAAGLLACLAAPVFVHDGVAPFARMREFAELLAAAPLAVLGRCPDVFERGLGYDFYRAFFALLKSLGLVAASLCISAPLGAALGWLAARRPGANLFRTAFTVLSSLPVFAAGYLVLELLTQRRWPDHFLWPVLVLALSDLSVTEMASHVADELKRELARPHVLLGRVLGLPDFRHYWRRFAVSVVETIRPRLPALLGGTIVVEKIFNINGLGRLALDAVDPRFGAPPAASRLIAVCVIAVLVVRLAALAERVLRSILTPGPLPEKSVIPWRDRIRETLRAATALPELAAGAFKFTMRGGLAAARRTRLRTLLCPLRAMRRWGRRSLVFFSSPQTTWPQQIEYGLVGAVWLCMGTIFAACILAPLFPERGWLGKDAFGHDLLLQILYAGRRSIGPWLGAVAGPLVLGTGLGAFAGYKDRGALCALIDLLINILDSLPRVLIVLAAAIVFGRRAYLTVLIPIMGLVFTPLVYHHVREKVRYLRARNFIEAEATLGLSPPAILFGHIIKNNCRSILAIQGSMIWGQVILLDVTMAYLQKDQPDFPTWGSLFAKPLLVNNNFAAAAPVLFCIIVFICGFTYVGDALRRQEQASFQA